jgi:hypothetical protein
MEKITEGTSHPFNSALETGIRALVVLEAFHPRHCDLTELTWLDHLVVHTSDIQGEDVPASLHPDLPNRTGELLVRRRLVEESLLLMQRVHLVDVVDSDNGISFTASEDAPSFLDLLKAPYTVELKKRATWIAKRFLDLSKSDISDLVDEKIGRWTAEFQLARSSTS